MSISSTIQKLRAKVSSLAPPDDSLSDLPRELELLLTRYEAEDVNPDFRADIHTLLRTSVRLAHLLGDDLAPTHDSSQLACLQIRILSRIMAHLSQRAHLTRVGIFFPATNQIAPETFATVPEAQEHLESLRRMGLTPEAVVLPITLQASYVLLPRPHNPGQTSDNPPLVDFPHLNPTPPPNIPEPPDLTDVIIIQPPRAANESKSS